MSKDNRNITGEFVKFKDINLNDDLNSEYEKSVEEKLKTIWEITLMSYFLKGQDFYASRFPRSIATFERFPS